MSDNIKTLLAAASAAGSAVIDMVECARDGSIRKHGNVVSGETLIAMADALRLLLDASSGGTEEENQLHGAVMRYLESS